MPADLVQGQWSLTASCTGHLCLQVLEDELLEEPERAQLQLENEALQKELETMVDQARQAESSMLEISNFWIN